MAIEEGGKLWWEQWGKITMKICKVPAGGYRGSQASKLKLYPFSITKVVPFGAQAVLGLKITAFNRLLLLHRSLVIISDHTKSNPASNLDFSHLV